MKRFAFILILMLVVLVASESMGKDAENIVSSTASYISVGNPVRYKNLTIFPLSLSRGRDGKQIVTFDHALKKDYIEIMEKESGDVNTVILRNRSKYYVFILAGEIITGCKQDRMVSEDCLIPPNSGKIHLSVYCTEHGRWTAQTKKFSAGGFAINPKMREVAKASKSQSEVWAHVEEKRSEVGAAPSATSAYMDIVEDDKVASEIKPYVDKFSNIPNVRGWRTVGVLAAVGDEIIVVDLFTNHKLLSELWDKLIKSYALDAVNRCPSGKLSKNDALQYIRELKDVCLTSRDTDGAGYAYTVDCDCSFGTTLIFDEKIVHLDLFPRAQPQPHPIKRVPMLDFRREGSQ
jgi:hypothetical protein